MYKKVVRRDWDVKKSRERDTIDSVYYEFLASLSCVIRTGREIHWTMDPQYSNIKSDVLLIDCDCTAAICIFASN
jgi:hypothetical protein